MAESGFADAMASAGIASPPDNIEQVESALSFISSEERDTWIQIGMAVKSGLGDAGFDLWDSWSQNAESYNQRDAESAWRSFDTDGGITVKTLFHQAKENGWSWTGPSRSPEEIARQE
ncbi:MAG: PriCT-2 domain-containing protein, partial [Desulfuromonadaceae bacterium]